MNIKNRFLRKESGGRVIWIPKAVSTSLRWYDPDQVPRVRVGYTRLSLSKDSPSGSKLYFTM